MPGSCRDDNCQFLFLPATPLTLTPLCALCQLSIFLQSYLARSKMRVFPHLVLIKCRNIEYFIGNNKIFTIFALLLVE